MNDKANASWHVSSPAAPVFLADIDRNRGMLRLHVRRGVDVHAVRERALAAQATQKHPLGIIVEQHSRTDLTQPRSLEHWIGRLAPGEVVYDPMLVVTRARHLVGLARSIRRILGKRSKGVFFDAARHVLVVVVRPIGDRAETMDLVQRAVDKASLGAAEVAAGALPDGIGIRIVSERPAADLVPVDRRSASVLGLLRGIVRRSFAPAAMALAGLAAVGPAAAAPNSRQILQAADPSHFGVLAGLSVLSEGVSQSRLDAFSSAALELYFGRSPAAEKALQLAQTSTQNTNTQNTNTQNTTSTQSTDASPGS